MNTKMDRRTFLQGTSVAALSSILPSGADATPVVAIGKLSLNSSLSQRSILNIGFSSGGGNEYRFIDHFLIAEQFGPVGTAWSSGQNWMQSIGANGYPKVSLKVTDNKPFGGGIRIPASFSYGAPGTNQ